MDEIDLGIPSERLIGFTVPNGDRFLVCDHDEVWEVNVGTSATICETDYAPYDVADQSDFIGWGKTDASPILDYADRTISYNFDPTASAATVILKTASGQTLVEFPTFSGDWFAASLSRDGKLLVIAEPYKIALYRIER
jgi:hypothetical protein